jgi:hypothetical protein
MRLRATLVLLYALAAGVAAQQAKPPSAEVLFKQALQKEQVDKDLPAALVLYTRLIELYPKHPGAARALLQLAGLHEREGRREQATAALRKIIAEHPSSRESADARARLKADVSPAVWRAERLEFGPADSVLAFSRDGRAAAVLLEGGLAVRDQGGTPRVIVPATPAAGAGFVAGAVWSRDGREVVFVWTVAGADAIESEIKAIAREGGQPRTIARLAHQVVMHGLSQDGQRALVSHLEFTPQPGGAAGHVRERLLTVGLRDGALKTIKVFAPYPNGRDQGVGHAVFSPDDRWIAFDFPHAAFGTRAISLISASAQAEHEFEASRTDDRIVDWAATGLLFVRDGDAWTVPVENGTRKGMPTLVARDVGAVRSLGTSTDGRVFVRKVIAGYDVYVATLDPVAGTVVSPPKLLNRPVPNVRRGPPAWSSDGTRLAYGKTGGLIVVQSLASGAVREYAVGLTVGELAWQPDDRALVAAGQDASQRAGLFQIDLDTERVEFLGAGRRALFGRAARDVIIARGSVDYPSANPCCPRLDLVTGQESRVDLLGPGFPTARSNEGNLLLVFVPATEELAIVPLDGGPRRTLVTKFPGVTRQSAFTRDGKFVFFMANSALWRVSADGGKPTPTGVTMAHFYDLAVSSDGQQVALTTNGRSTETWVWQHVIPKGRP